MLIWVSMRSPRWCAWPGRGRSRITAVGRSEQVSGFAESASEVQPRPESSDEQKARILKEVRASLTDDQLDALGVIFKAAFDARHWPTRVSASDDA